MTTRLRFDTRDVPCTPDAIRYLRDFFRPEEWRSAESNADAAKILAGFPDDPDDIHRYLLDLRRSRGKWSPLYRDIGQVVDRVRPHSRLYTSRTCECVRAAWNQFSAEVTAALAALEGLYTVTSRGTTWSDYRASTNIRELVEYAGVSRYSARIPNLVEVTFDSAATFTLRATQARRVREWTFTQLPPQLATLADRVRHSPTGTVRAAGAWVREWPPPMVAAFSAWGTLGATGRATAVELLEHDVADLSDAEVALAVALIGRRDGRTTPAGVLALTRRAAARGTPTLLRLLAGWLEAGTGPVDETTLDALLDSLAAGGVTDLTERGVRVALRLVATWPGDLVTLAETAATVASEPDPDRIPA